MRASTAALPGLLLLVLAAPTVADTVGQTGCSVTNCQLINAYLRFGTAENSLNAWGLLQQPFYYSSTQSSWLKLTFLTQPWDFAVGTGTGSAQWSGTTNVELYGLTPSGVTIDYSGMTITATDGTTSEGYGTIIWSGTYTINGQAISIAHTYFLGQTAKVIEVQTNFTNTDSVVASNMYAWVGSRDDYVGGHDSSTKTRGNVYGGTFSAISTASEQASAIEASTTAEFIFLYTTSLTVNAVYSDCCVF